MVNLNISTLYNRVHRAIHLATTVLSRNKVILTSAVDQTGLSYSNLSDLTLVTLAP